MATKHKFDKRIEIAYRNTCLGIQINMLDIPKVFDVGTKAITDKPTISDRELETIIFEFVQKIKV